MQKTTRQIKQSIPKDWPVKPILIGSAAARLLGARVSVCGTCGLGWDDEKVTSMTPAPSARCPFESFHTDDEIKTEIKDQHTPGPWRVSVGLNNGYIASENNGFVPIRTPFRERAFSDAKHMPPFVTESELTANARLIAAAPELLAALKAVYYDLMNETSVGVANQSKRLAAITIAKAEGR